MEAQGMHRQAARGADQMRQEAFNLRKFKTVCATIGNTLMHWPHAERTPKQAVETMEKCKRVRARPTNSHSWTFRKGIWRCSACLAQARSEKAKQHKSWQVGTGFAPKLVAAATDQLGHSLVSAETSDEQPLMFCIRCGAWAVSKPVGLLKRCIGENRLDAGKSALARIARKQHPDFTSKASLATLTPMGQHDLAAVRQMLDQHLTRGGCINRPSPVFAERLDAYLARASPETAAETRMRMMHQRVVAGSNVSGI